MIHMEVRRQQGFSAGRTSDTPDKTAVVAGVPKVNYVYTCAHLCTNVYTHMHTQFGVGESDAAD